MTQPMEVLGWSPSGDFDEVDFSNVLQAPLDPQLKSSATTLLTPLEVSPPPPSSSSSSSCSPSPYHPQRTSSQRRRDPDHIPRPRNSFIIFRCDYTRQHCSGNGDQGDQGSTDAEKTSLSKRAAEAWKNVSADVKRHYKILADQEREEHIRRNPEYRFRPKRRQSLPVTYASRSASEVKLESVELDGVPGLQRIGDDSRSRSSSISSLSSSLSDSFGSSSSASSLGSIPAISSKHPHFPLRRHSSPQTRLRYIPTSPKSPYTPLDSPAELSSCLVNVQEQDFFMHPADSILTPTSATYQFDDIFHGNLVAVNSGIPGVHEHSMSPLAAISEADTWVASSLTGWDGDNTFLPPPFSISESDPPLLTPPALLFDYESQLPSSDPYPGLGACGHASPTTTDITSFDSAVQQNLDSYMLGLGDSGIDLSAFKFDTIALSS